MLVITEKTQRPLIGKRFSRFYTIWADRSRLDVKVN